MARSHRGKRPGVFHRADGLRSGRRWNQHRLGTALDPDHQYLAQWGYVDVTAPPFNADPTGQADSTRGIQHAIDFAREHYMVAFFPAGRYRVSDTLSCAQALVKRTTLKLMNDPEGPCVLIGSRSGLARPRIVLEPNARGFVDPAKPKQVIHIWARSYDKSPEEPQPNISYNQQVINLDVEIGQGKRREQLGFDCAEPRVPACRSPRSMPRTDSPGWKAARARVGARRTSR